MQRESRRSLICGDGDWIITLGNVGPSQAKGCWSMQSRIFRRPPALSCGTLSSTCTQRPAHYQRPQTIAGEKLIIIMFPQASRALFWRHLPATIPLQGRRAFSTQPSYLTFPATLYYFTFYQRSSLVDRREADRHMFDYSHPGPTLEGVHMAEDGLVYPDSDCLLSPVHFFEELPIPARRKPQAADHLGILAPASNGAGFRPDTIDMQQLTRQLTDFYYTDPKEEGKPSFQPYVWTVPKGKSTAYKISPGRV